AAQQPGSEGSPSPAPEQPQASGSGLPRTGSDLLVAVALGLILVAGGSWLLARREQVG
ncbi:MAG: LPXTG cell wall anchor domain-containing protein, partial [Frankiales bacterium]